MEWVIGAAAAFVLYLYGRSHSWFGGAGSGPIVCDVETDMPDQLKQAVLAQVAAQKNPASLLALATSLQEGDFIQSAYCLTYRAWVLSGSKGAPPAPPTAAQIALAQAMRQQNAGNLGQLALGQMQLAPGSPNMSVNVGTLISLLGGTPHVTGDSSTFAAMSANTIAVVGPGTISVSWGDGSTTTLTAIANPAAQPAMVASTAPVTSTPSGTTPAPVSTATAAAAAAAAVPTPPTTAPSVPGLDPATIAQATNAIASLAASAAAANLGQQIPATDTTVPSA